MKEGHSAVRVWDAIGDRGMVVARGLFRAYADEFAGTIAETLCFQGFEEELGGLPGRYAPPSGCLLLAMDGEIPAGCVAMRDLGLGTSEMKRLYVSPSYRGLGTGRLLVEEVIRRAERLGHVRMVLDTMPEMAGAIALYKQCRFVECAPYWDHPADRAVFMERSIRGGSAHGS